MIVPCACITIGTRRTMPSRSARMVNRPRPLPACSRTGTLRSRPGKFSRKGRASPPMVAMPIGGLAPSGCATAKGRPDSPSTTRELRSASAKTASLLGKARSFVRVASSRSRKASAATPGDIRSGSANTMSNAITSAPICSQAVDEIGDARARPRPLADRPQALLVDIDDDDRPLRRIARMQHLEQIEDANPKLLDRQRIGDRAVRRAR